MSAPRIAVIGAGVAGCGAALRAAQLGADEITLIEAGHPGGGSSGLSAGVYNIQTVDPLDIEIRIRARELLFRLEAAGTLHLARIGNVRVAYTDADMARLAAARQVQRDLGATDSLLLDRAALQELVPDLVTSDLAGGLHGPDDGHLDGHLLCSALLDEARASGVRLLTRTQVVGHERTPGGHRLRTTEGDVAADVVINAAGAWGSRVGELLGVRVPLVPQVHEVVQVQLRRPLPYVVPMTNLYMPGMTGEGLYFRQDGPDSLIAGMHTYVVQDEGGVADPDDYRRRGSDAYLEQVAEALTERFLVEDLGFKPGWTGLYPLSPDGRFILGPHEQDPTVISCTGLGGVGVTMGSIAGFTAAEWAVTGRPTTVPGAEVLRPDRATLTDLVGGRP
ncbi:NAD(P)/FAD-dependent oxidoreductase [Modestobacter sp. I12A-02662]|uniref:NAD(P)/FAD-dependent oxidoreductase n=1 Tax=Modestobacter sp. I12A-02662 TaxID=1730496 RepID=UPI0034DEA797